MLIEQASVGQASLEFLAEGHQLVDFGDDAELLGERRQWESACSKLAHIDGS
ncbi:hypothetical protein D9M69_707090 [compost metagenome]